MEAPVHAEANGRAIPAMTVEVYIRNKSPQPVYDLRIEWRVVTADLREITGGTYYQPIIMPDGED